MQTRQGNSGTLSAGESQILAADEQATKGGGRRKDESGNYVNNQDYNLAAGSRFILNSVTVWHKSLIARLGFGGRQSSSGPIYK
jgi:hypothetical protein